MKKITKVWTTGDGQKTRICDMPDDHLLNALAWCERTHEATQHSSAPPMFNGEMAQMCAERDWERLQENGPEESFPLYLDLHAEAERRGLKRLEVSNAEG
jgi:hypothetical protein